MLFIYDDGNNIATTQQVRPRVRVLGDIAVFETIADIFRLGGKIVMLPGCLLNVALPRMVYSRLSDLVPS